MDNQGFPYDFLDYRKIPFLIILKKILSYEIIHLHVSNVYVKLIVALYGKFLKKKILITYHGNLNQYKGIKYTINNLSLKYAFTPIVLNKNSFEKAVKINNKVQLITAFVPPTKITESKEDKIVQNKINMFIKGNEEVICCTNGKYILDKNGQDLYGILDLIKLFNSLEDKYKLIISDPTKTYSSEVEQMKLSLGNNIMMIKSQHSFVNIIKQSDIVIRNTTTDGDSLTVKEGLFFSKIVLATNVVNRPKGVIIYDDIDDIKKKLFSLEKRNPAKSAFNENAAEDIIGLYKNLLHG